MPHKAKLKETLNKLISFMPFDFAQESLVEGFIQSFLNRIRNYRLLRCQTPSWFVSERWRHVDIKVLFR